MSDAYNDRFISCTGSGVEIRGYYFPWGTKRIAYGAIKSARLVQIGTWSGKLRLWGSGDLRHWFNLDPDRPKKDRAIVLDLGRRMVPVITPEQPDVVIGILRDHGAPTSD